MAKDKKRITDLDRKKRLLSIQEIYEKINNKEKVDDYPRLSKVAYILWQYPSTRNSDRTHAIQYYKTFHPDLVNNEQISFKNLYLLPKMYDLQRDRATIQNTELLFPAKNSTIKKRLDRELEYKTYYANKNSSIFTDDTKYYLYLDESGKTDKYFVLGGLLINEYKNNAEIQTKILEIKDSLCEKYNIKIDEFKFGNICTKNKSLYYEFLEKLRTLNIKIIYVSILIENAALSQKSKKNKTKELLKLLLHECLEIITEYICCASYQGVTSELNVILDKDGAGYDLLEQEVLKTEIKDFINRKYKYFSVINDIHWVNSTDNILIQLSDLYAGSINNIFSEIKNSSETAKSKKEFAKNMLNMVGIEKIDDIQQTKKHFGYINKCIIK